MRDLEYLGFACISHEKLMELGLSIFSVISLRVSDHVSTILEVTSFQPDKASDELNVKERNLIVHPIVEETLMISAPWKNKNKMNDMLLPNQFILTAATEKEDQGIYDAQIESIMVTLQPIENIVNVETDGDIHLHVSLSLLYSTLEGYDTMLLSLDDDDDYCMSSFLKSQVKNQLLFKHISKGTIAFVPLPPIHGPLKSSQVAVFSVTDVRIVSDGSDDKGVTTDHTYRVRSTQNVHLFVSHGIATSTISRKESKNTGMKCPGYESLVEELVSFATLPVIGAAPSGILIRGCKGVGKTRLSMAVLEKILGYPMSSYNILSAKDVVLYASSIFDFMELRIFIEKCIIKTPQGQTILILDDLDYVVSQDDESPVEIHKRNALNAIITVVDALRQSNAKSGPGCFPVFLLGLLSDVDRVPSVLTKSGRFEKSISMFPPTVEQRQEILSEIMRTLPTKDVNCDVLTKWSKAIAPYTGGCVASDLMQICVNALTRSMARSDVLRWVDIKEATRACIPSQLTQLDVTLATYVDDDDHEDVHFKSKNNFSKAFRCFGGYDEVKRKIFRTIILPWIRYNERDSPSNLSYNEVLPPTGVLFHGPSGTGKTFAAECLANALKLNVIRIRSSDILDQWLGGSEAAVRAIFARARSANPCILLFDELDSITVNREDSDGDSSSGVYSRLLSTLLNEMDGVSSDIAKTRLLIIGTTNRISALDAALLRPGRFEEHILLELPSACDIHAMLVICLAKVPLDHELDLFYYAELLEELGATAADVKGICTESCIHAIHEVVEGEEIDSISLKSDDIMFAIHSWKR